MQPDPFLEDPWGGAIPALSQDGQNRVTARHVPCEEWSQRPSVPPSLAERDLLEPHGEMLRMSKQLFVSRTYQVVLSGLQAAPKSHICEAELSEYCLRLIYLREPWGCLILWQVPIYSSRDFVSHPPW